MTEQTIQDNDPLDEREDPWVSLGYESTDPEEAARVKEYRRSRDIGHIQSAKDAINAARQRRLGQATVRPSKEPGKALGYYLHGPGKQEADDQPPGKLERIPEDPATYDVQTREEVIDPPHPED